MPSTFYIAPVVNPTTHRVNTVVTRDRDKLPMDRIDIFVVKATSESNARKTYRKHFPRGLESLPQNRVKVESVAS